MKLVDYPTLRARRLCLGQFPALCGGRNRCGPLELRDDCHGAPYRRTDTACTRRPFDVTDTASNGNAFVGGVAAGLGINWAVTPGMYLRAEWEYVAFAPVNGSRPNINAGKIGAGARF